MMEYSGKIEKFARETVALWWLLSALFALPLAWLRLGGAKVPLYGVAEAVTRPYLAVAAVAVLLWCGGVKDLYRDRSWQIFGMMQVLLLTIAGGHLWAGNMNIADAGTVFFAVLAPTVGAVLKTELERVLPLAGTFTAVLLLISGFTSENFTGLTGNWNWTQGLLFALLPGVFLLMELKKWQYFAGALLLILAVVIYWYCPEQFSRGAGLAAIAAAAVLYLVQRLPERYRKWVVITGIFLVCAGFAVFLLTGDIMDSRFQLWKGAGRMFADSIWTGHGQFGNRILAFLPEKYSFTPFAAIWHPHPHNEMLNFLCRCGVGGGMFLAVLFYLSVCRPVTTGRELFSRWVFLVLFFCGQFDLHCAVTAGAVWAFTCAGIAAGKPHPGSAVPVPLWRWVTGGAVLIAAIGLTLNHWRAGTAQRLGELALHRGDRAGARRYLQQSLRYEKLPHALYILAETELFEGRVHYAGILLDELRRQRLENYFHARRLRGMVEFRSGNGAAALRELEIECRNYPFSVISAGFRWQLLKFCRAPETELHEAQAYFYGVCRMRGIDPRRAAHLTVAEDDRPLKNPTP